MSVTLQEALDQLNDDQSDNLVEVSLYVDAANEWIEARVSDTSPAPVRLATLFLIEHWWQSQRGPASAPFEDGDPIVFNGRSYAIPNRVLEILGPYLLDDTTTPQFSFPDAVAFPDPAEWPV